VTNTGPLPASGIVSTNLPDLTNTSGLAIDSRNWSVGLTGNLVQTQLAALTAPAIVSILPTLIVAIALVVAVVGIGIYIAIKGKHK